MIFHSTDIENDLRKSRPWSCTLQYTVLFSQMKDDLLSTIFFLIQLLKFHNSTHNTQFHFLITRITKKMLSTRCYMTDHLQIKCLTSMLIHFYHLLTSYYIMWKIFTLFKTANILRTMVNFQNVNFIFSIFICGIKYCMDSEIFVWINKQSFRKQRITTDVLDCLKNKLNKLLQGENQTIECIMLLYQWSYLCSLRCHTMVFN